MRGRGQNSNDLHDSKKILLLSEVFPPANGGSGRWFYEMYRRLQEYKTVYAVGAHQHQEKFDRLVDAPINRIHWRMTNRGIADYRHYARLVRDVSKIARIHSVDELHAGRPLSEGLIALLVKIRFGIPYAVYVHGEDIEASRTSRELTWLASRVLRNAALVIANSTYTRRQLKWWRIRGERCSLLHPGVNMEYFTPTDDIDALRKKYGWDGRRVLLTVGRLQRRKGHDVAIEAIAKLSERWPQILYAIVGVGPEREQLEGRVAALGIGSQVSFLGEADDMQLKQFYQACDYFALPNRTDGNDVEGFGMVLLEAQASGKPVIAGRSGGTSDTLDPGKTGVLLDCTNPTELTETLNRWLEDPAEPERLAKNARSFVDSRFSWDAVAGRADRLFAGKAEPSDCSVTANDRF